MNSNNKGLTVGELTITIAVLIIAFLAWSAFKEKNETKAKAYLQVSQSLSIEKISQ